MTFTHSTMIGVYSRADAAAVLQQNGPFWELVGLERSDDGTVYYLAQVRELLLSEQDDTYGADNLQPWAERAARARQWAKWESEGSL